jgi:hypothetical protein
MINKFTLLTVLLAATASASSFAQTSASATQTIHIQVAPIIQIGNGNNGNGNGSGSNNNNGNGNHGNGNNGNHNGNGNGNKMAAPDNGSGFQKFTVNSNKGFIVSVQSAGNNTEENILMALSDNRTGGQSNPTFTNSYAPVQATSQDLIMNCAFGAEKTFAVNYKAKSNKKTNNKSTTKQSLTKADLVYTATLP